MEPNINNEELLVLLQTLANSIQKGLGGQQDLGVKVSMIDARVGFVNDLLLNQLEQLRKEWNLSSTSISAKITEIDRQVGVLQDNQKRIESQVYKEEYKEDKEEEKKHESLGRFIVGKVVSNPGVVGFIILICLTILGWGTALVEHFTGREVESYTYPTLENKGPEQKN